MTELLRKIDDAVYRAERLVVVVGLLVMAGVVFLDVTHRTFADPDSKIAEWLVAVLGDGRRALAEAVAPGLGLVLAVGAVVFAQRSVRRERPVPMARAVVVAVALVAGATALVQALVHLVPNGFVWSQPFALILLLWVGFFGASMCTHEGKHLRVEAVERYLPERWQRPVGLVRGLVTATFLLFLTAASWDYVQFHYQEWVETEHLGGMFQGVDVPRWVGFLALPISFFIMAARFLADGVATFRGTAARHDAVADLVGAAAVGEELGELADELAAGGAGEGGAP